jgi:hypothetical protein
MKTDQALDKMALLAPWYGEIFDDEDAACVIQAARMEKGETLAGSTMAKLVPLFAQRHREALYNIISITTDTDIETIRAQPIMDTIAALRNALVNETLMFFMTCLQMVKHI